jgi:hypothetical protein
MQTWCIGAAIKNTGSGYAHFFCVEDGSTIQMSILWNADGTVTAKRGGYSGTSLGTSTLTATPNAWHYFDVKYVIDNSAGVVIVKVDGVEFLNLTSQDTNQTANAYAATLYPLQWAQSAVVYLTDLYVDDATQHGDCRVHCLVPTGVGNYSQWTPSAGSNYACVDEKPPDTADYVSAGTAGKIDTYVVENLSVGAGTVYAVAGNFYCKKLDGGSRTIALATRLSSTDDAGSGIALPSDWAFIQDIKETKPGGGAWAVADVNDAEMGQKMIA